MSPACAAGVYNQLRQSGVRLYAGSSGGWRWPARREAGLVEMGKLFVVEVRELNACVDRHNEVRWRRSDCSFS